MWKWLTKLLWLFPLVIAIVSVASPPRAGEGWIPFAIMAGFSAICVPLTLEVFKRCIELSEAGIVQRSAWSKPVAIGWQDVRDIAWKAMSEIEVRGKRGRSIRISLWLSGLDTLADEFEQRLAHVPSAATIVARLARVPRLTSLLRVSSTGDGRG